MFLPLCVSYKQDDGVVKAAHVWTSAFRVSMRKSDSTMKICA